MTIGRDNLPPRRPVPRRRRYRSSRPFPVRHQPLVLTSVGGTSGTRYSDIVSALDTATRTERSYLANEGNFAYVKGMEQKNLIIPIVGDFAGPKALRAIGTYLRERNAVVSAFYVSNVEMYLQNNGVWEKFCANVATMPLDASSIFIRPGGGGVASGDLSPMAADTARCRR